MPADHGKTNWKFAAGLVLALLIGFQTPIFGGELVFEPYRCRTAIAGMPFESPPPKLQVSQTGVRYRISRGPSGLTVNADSGVRWASPTVGRHVIRIEATKGSNSDELEWILRVVPKENADDLIVHSTEYLDFVLTKRQLKGDIFLKRTHYLDGIWQCYSRLVGQEPLSDLQVLTWDPTVSGALAGNPIRMGGTGEARPMGWTDSVWQRHGVDHELAHNFNYLIRTPGTWSSTKFVEGFGQPWLDLYLHHLCDNDIVILQATVLNEPKLFGLNAAELKNYKAFVANNVFSTRIAPDSARNHLELIRNGKTMQEAAATSGNSTWQHLINTIVQRDGVDVLEGAFRAMRHDGLPDEIFQDADTPERKFSLLVSLFSASAKRDLRPFFADWGFVVEKDYYENIHPRVQAEMKNLLPKDVWLDGWIKSPVNGHFYRVLTWETDREQASRTARQWGGRLLEVHSAAEQKWLARRYSHLGPVWLGLHDEKGTGEWTWDSGARATETYWNPNDPKTPQKRYAVLDRAEPRGTWRQRSGSTQSVVIVERTDGVDLLARTRPRTTAAAPSEILSVKDALGQVGETVTVQLSVKSTREFGKLIFLDSHANPRDEGNFPVVLRMGQYATQPGAVPDPKAFYHGKTIRATGEVGLYRGRPQMRLTHPDQIEIVEHE